MKAIINPRIHGYLDYFTVIVFLLAPSLLSLSGVAGLLSYTLAIIHLAMTLVTDFPLGMITSTSPSPSTSPTCISVVKEPG